MSCLEELAQEEVENELLDLEELSLKPQVCIVMVSFFI